MHVVHLNLERGWRGGERQVAWLVRELAGQAGGGLTQTVIGREGEDLLERVAGVRGVRLVPVRGRLGALTAMRREPVPAVLHAHTASTVPVAALGRRAGDVLVATRRLDLPVSRFWWRRADRVAAISRSVASSLEASGLDPERIVGIPSGIDRSRRLDPEQRNMLRAELGVPSGIPLGLTVAALEPQKDPFTLAGAFAFLPLRYRHVWVGDGSLYSELKSYLALNGLSERFLLAGFNPDPDKWYAACDLYVLPSRHEGLGTSVLDAFHFGLPVVGSRIPGTADVLEDQKTALLFQSGDAGGLAERVGRLLDEPELRERLVAAGRLKLDGYDIKNTASLYLDLYRRLQGN